MSEKTQFAGLTRLAVGESLAADNFSFQNRNPTITDLLLRLGAVAHRHDAHQALAAPAQDPFLEIAALGGQIPADTAIYVAYTYLDADGGETLPNPSPGVISTAPGILTPDDAPQLAIDHAAGTLLAGTYAYAVTVVDGFGGETRIGPFATVTIPSGTVVNEIAISGLAAILAATGGVAWRLWKRVNGGQLGMVNQGATDTIVDDGTFAVDCTVAPPTTVGSTNATNKLNVTVPGAAPAGAVQFRIYASTDGSFPSPCLLGTYPIADAGNVKGYLTLQAGDGAPPDVSTAFPGASFINADTQIINLRLKPPVDTAANLPISDNNRDGDLRMTLDDYTLHAWNANGLAWQLVAGAGGTSGHTILYTTNVDAVLAARTNLSFSGPHVVVTDDAPFNATRVAVNTPPTLLATRQVVTMQMLAAVTNDAAAFDMVAPKGYVLMKVESTADVRVRLYTTLLARTNDALRDIDTPPLGAAHGILFDAEVTPAEPISLTPALYCWNGDTPADDTSYGALTALADGDVTVTLTLLRTEA